jgi:hypothetical protein
MPTLPIVPGRRVPPNSAGIAAYGRLTRVIAVGVGLLPFFACALAPDPETARPKAGCRGLEAKACLGLAMGAMGGRDRLEAIQNVTLDVIGHTSLMEQSYRQDPFINSYERDRVTIDFSQGRIREVQHAIWPESDPKEAESDSTLIATLKGGAYIFPNGSAPSSAADLDSARETLELGPERLLMTAALSADLHYDPDEMIRSTLHIVLAFRWNGVSTRILIDGDTHLPDAVETIRQFRDFWYFWGDVRQRVYWDNWKVLHGIVYPTNQITERNGSILTSMQVLDLDVNQPIDEKAFALQPACPLPAPGRF